MKRVPFNQKFNSPVRRERDSISLARLTAVLVCGLILTVGFIRAAAHHTVAVRYGYESEALRRARARLLDEQNHLLAERNVASSPSQLEVAARRIGLEQARADHVAIANRTSHEFLGATDGRASTASRGSNAAVRASRPATVIGGLPGMRARRR